MNLEMSAKNHMFVFENDSWNSHNYEHPERPISEIFSTFDRFWRDLAKPIKSLRNRKDCRNLDLWVLIWAWISLGSLYVGRTKRLLWTLKWAQKITCLFSKTIVEIPIWAWISLGSLYVGKNKRLLWALKWTQKSHAWNLPNPSWLSQRTPKFTLSGYWASLKIATQAASRFEATTEQNITTNTEVYIIEILSFPKDHNASS